MDNSLFRLEYLAGLQNLSIAPDAAEIIEHLRPLLEHYAELEFRSDGRRIDIITLSDDVDAAATFLRLLEARGVCDSDLVIARALLRFGLGKVVGMKLPIAGPITGGEIYIRGALPLGEVAYFLERYGVESEALEQLHAMAAIFGKGHTHMLASDIAANISFSVFFTVYLVQDSDDQSMLRRALEATGITDQGISAFLRLHRMFGADRPKTLYYSCSINKPAVVRAKIDYANVRLGSIAEGMDLIGSSTNADVPARWARLLGLSKANYAGIVVGSDGPMGLRAYFTRRLRRGELP